MPRPRGAGRGYDDDGPIARGNDLYRRRRSPCDLTNVLPGRRIAPRFRIKLAIVGVALHGGTLTSREGLVFHLIAERHENKEMSRIVNWRVKTIETHRATAMRTLSVTSTAVIVQYAI